MLEVMLTGNSGSTRMNRTRSLTRTMRTTSVTSVVVMAVPAVLETLISRSWVVLTPVLLLDLVDSLAKRKQKVLRVTR